MYGVAEVHPGPQAREAQVTITEVWGRTARHGTLVPLHCIQHRHPIPSSVYITPGAAGDGTDAFPVCTGFCIWPRLLTGMSSTHLYRHYIGGLDRSLLLYLVIVDS